MRITFYSNFINHHQIPLCEAFIRLVGKDNFTFVATEPIPTDRIKLGYRDENKKYNYILTTYDSHENEIKAIRLSVESDIVILGSASDKYIIKRLSQGKIAYRYCERYFKNGWKLSAIPRNIFVSLLKHKRFERKKLMYLCSSAYTAGDVNKFADYSGRTFKWGYFPEVFHYELDDLMIKKHHKRISLLWAGRLISWKHPEIAVLLADRIKKRGIDFELNIIGVGELEREIERKILDLQLEDNVKTLGSMPPEKVRTYMENADVFLFTSDSHEGWGAVLNEAMNSGCAVVASHAIGAVPFLIKHGINGIVYKDGDFEDFCDKVNALIDDPAERKKIGCNAYYSVVKLWNANEAAERLIKLDKCIKLNATTPFLDGPCSVAEIFNENTVYDMLMCERS